MKDLGPERIVCLTEEPTELLYLLGEEDRIVGISGFTVRPERARKEKPKVSLFTDASIDKILDLKPDLVIGFSDIQADIASQLIKKGVSVWISNHRSIQEIKSFIYHLSSIVNRKEEGLAIIENFEKRKAEIQAMVRDYEIKPSVYFEEWFDPLISGISWVNELIVIAGGLDVYSNNARQSLAKDRIIENPNEVIKKNPDIILASWCGKMFKKKKLVSREGWDMIAAVQKDDIYEIDSAIILQPGPAALSDGLESIHRIIHDWVQRKKDE